VHPPVAPVGSATTPSPRRPGMKKLLLLVVLVAIGALVAYKVRETA
jgi:hypothetical protein